MQIQTCKVGQNLIYTPNMTIYLMISLPIIPYIRINILYMYSSGQLYIHVLTHIHIHAYTHTDIQTYIHTYIHTHIHTQMHIPKNIYIGYT